MSAQSTHPQRKAEELAGEAAVLLEQAANLLRQARDKSFAVLMERGDAGLRAATARRDAIDKALEIVENEKRDHTAESWGKWRDRYAPLDGSTDARHTAHST